MSVRAARIGAGTYFVVMLLVSVWPGALPFARVRPFVLGLPFSLAWLAAWILGGVLVLTVLDRVERSHRAAHGATRGVERSSGPAGDEPAGGAR